MQQTTGSTIFGSHSIQLTNKIVRFLWVQWEKCTDRSWCDSELNWRWNQSCARGMLRCCESGSSTEETNRWFCVNRNRAQSMWAYKMSRAVTPVKFIGSFHSSYLRLLERTLEWNPPGRCDHSGRTLRLHHWHTAWFYSPSAVHFNRWFGCCIGVLSKGGQRILAASDCWGQDIRNNCLQFRLWRSVREPKLIENISNHVLSSTLQWNQAMSRSRFQFHPRYPNCMAPCRIYFRQISKRTNEFKN